MKISEAIETLKEIQEKFGDIEITGGRMSDDQPPRNIIVTDKTGYEIWPRPFESREKTAKEDIDGVLSLIHI